MGIDEDPPPAEMLEMLEMSWVGGNGNLQYFSGGNKYPTPRDGALRSDSGTFYIPGESQSIQSRVLPCLSKVVRVQYRDTTK